MESHWAREHLEVIRTLMERAAIYRRALAPTTLTTGAIGSLAALAGWAAGIESPRGFGLFWILVGGATAAAALLVVRRQALREAEPFWSPPTRRVTHALVAPLVVGLVVGLLTIAPAWREPLQVWWLPPVWMVLYGCALHAAGFFMPRGMRLFGWLFIGLGCALMAVLTQRSYGAGMPSLVQAHWVMGASFGGLHLAYGAYLHLTENRKNAA
jgi:hypothetical protein